jgi:hypothetical protein
MTPSNSDSYDDGLAVSAPIALGDVLALQVPVHWAEAVAVVEELCAVLVDVAGASVRIPELQDIAITSQGTVLLRRGAAMTQDIDGLGRALHALLDPAATPMPLRLFVAQSNGVEKYNSVAAYAGALAYYGRPDRSEMIQSLYRRCLETPAPDILRAPASEEFAPKAEARRKVPRWVLAAAIALLCTLAASAFWMSGQEARAAAPVRALQRAVDAVVAVVQNLTSPSEPAAKLSDKSANPSVRPAGRRRSEPPPADVILNVTPLFTSPFLDTPAREAAPDGALAMAPFVEGSAAAEDSTIYSSVADNVQPPVLFSPKLPPIPAIQPYYAVGTNTMELLIDEAGFVKRVRMTSPPVRMPDMMLLSGAKTWRFHPALKNGKPVKYRLAMSWIVTPP